MSAEVEGKDGSSLSLEEIAGRIAPEIKMQPRETSRDFDSGARFQRVNRLPVPDPSIKGSGCRSYSASQRFGEVLNAFLEGGTITHVAKKTGITSYLLNKYYFSDPEFCELLKGTNEAIFLEATKEIRDTQKGFLQKAQLLAEEALDEMERLLNESPSEHIRFKVAQDLLDRDPRISRTKRIEGAGVTVQIDVKTLSLAATAAREIDELPGGTKFPQETAAVINRDEGEKT